MAGGTTEILFLSVVYQHTATYLLSGICTNAHYTFK